MELGWSDPVHSGRRTSRCRGRGGRANWGGNRQQQQQAAAMGWMMLSRAEAQRKRNETKIVPPRVWAAKLDWMDKISHGTMHGVAILEQMTVFKAEIMLIE